MPSKMVFLLKIFVSVSMLVACVHSQAESAGDPRRLSASIGTSTVPGIWKFSSQLMEVLQREHNLVDIFKKDLGVSTLRDCSEAPASGVYTIQPDGDGPLLIKVYCDMETDGGGWTVFQRRQDGSLGFYKIFSDYSQGFGNLEGEFWLGNEVLNLLTTRNEYELRVDMSDYYGNSAYAVYDTFRVGDLADKYRLTVGGYNGTAGDSLSYHNGMYFTTKDRDNDYNYEGNCANTNFAAWWYRMCHKSNLNGQYKYFGVDSIRGLVWMTWKPEHYALKTTEMKIRMKG